MAFARRGHPDKSKTWRQVKSIEAKALDGASAQFKQRWDEYSDPQDLQRSESLGRDSTQATIAAHIGAPRFKGADEKKKAEDLLDRLRAHRKQRLKGDDHEL